MRPRPGPGRVGAEAVVNQVQIFLLCNGVSLARTLNLTCKKRLKSSNRVQHTQAWSAGCRILVSRTCLEWRGTERVA